MTSMTAQDFLCKAPQDGSLAAAARCDDVHATSVPLAECKLNVAKKAKRNPTDKSFILAPIKTRPHRVGKILGRIFVDLC